MVAGVEIDGRLVSGSVTLFDEGRQVRRGEGGGFGVGGWLRGESEFENVLTELIWETEEGKFASGLPWSPFGFLLVFRELR